MPMSEPESRDIRIQELTKIYGRTRAINRVNMDVRDGEFLTIVGPNGAGKSTLLGIIAGLIRPSRGNVWLDGVDLVTERDEINGRKIGVLSYHSYLYDELTINENLRFYGALYDVDHLDQKIPVLLERVGMATRSNSMVKTLSRGMSQRVALARVMLHDPPILLLDEPYVGLDQEAMAMLQEFLFEKKRTVLLVTHDLNRGLEVSERIVIMDRGRVMCDTPSNGMSPEAFDTLYRQSTISF